VVAAGAVLFLLGGRGTIPGRPFYFDRDNHHRFFAGKRMLVCGNTASMLQHTRLVQDFTVSADQTGPFECGPAVKKSASSGKFRRRMLLGFEPNRGSFPT
jgi:hypothetical protein